LRLDSCRIEDILVVFIVRLGIADNLLCLECFFREDFQVCRAWLLTFREGLLPKPIALPLTTCWTLLAGVKGDGSPVSSTSSGIPPLSFSCELEGPIASLLATGVMLLTAVFLKAGFLTGTWGLAMALTAFEVSLAFRTPLDEFGVPDAGAFEKKLAIDR
jgi:hypothetical protein